ncbi:MAG: hypothetical protein LLG01_17285 [Planctomycetaceae bacterium]|nr:hypothetical protein [Planctomycetaceae bacterium]
MAENQPSENLQPRAKTSVWSQVARLVQRTPEWVLALVLLAPIHIIKNSGFYLVNPQWLDIAVDVMVIVALALPGAIHRLNAWQVLVMAALGTVAGFLKITVPAPWPYWWAANVSIGVVWIAVLEWIWKRPRQKSALVAVLLATIVVASIVAAALEFASDRLLIFHQSAGSYFKVPLQSLIYGPLVALLTWICLPLALRLGRSNRHIARYVGAAAGMACLGLFMLMFHVLIYPLALWSLEAPGPLKQETAAKVLAYRGRDNDFEAIWAVVARDAWTEPTWNKPTDWRPREKPLRDFYVRVLAWHRPQRYAPRLAKLLLQKPTSALAEAVAPLMAAQKQYEVLPVLVWHANVPGIGGEAQEALEKMEVPCAAINILAEASWIHSREQLGGNFRISSSTRKKLVRLFKEDRGEMYRDWSDLLYLAGRLDDPAAKPYESDVQKVLDCFYAYVKYLGRLQRARNLLYTRKIEQSGNPELIAILQKLESLSQEQRETFSRSDAAQTVPNSPSVTYQMGVLLEEARRETEVPLPQWREAGVESLQKDVRRYEDEVMSLIFAKLPEVAQPATQPGTPPVR